MDTVTKPKQCIGHWLKASPLADVTHCILRYDGLILVTYCGRTISLAEARRPVRGARHCETCESLHRSHMKKRSAHAVARK